VKSPSAVYTTMKGGSEIAKSAMKKTTITNPTFERAISLTRHGRASELEEPLNEGTMLVSNVVEVQDEFGNTLLHHATQNGSKRMVKACLRRGACVNAQNYLGQTPLHFAFGFGYNELGDYLISKGADATLRNKDGLTCFEGMSVAELEKL